MTNNNIFITSKEFKIDPPKIFDELNNIHTESKEKRKEFIENRSWLKKGHPLAAKQKIDWKLFGHLNGDGHIAGTPLEGYTTNKSVGYFHGFMKHLLESAEQDSDSYKFLHPIKNNWKNFATKWLLPARSAKKFSKFPAMGSLFPQKSVKNSLITMQKNSL